MQKRYKIIGFGTLTKCSECGKEVNIPDPSQWVYRIGSQYFCTYTCFRKKQKTIEKTKKHS